VAAWTMRIAEVTSMLGTLGSKLTRR